MNLNEFGNEELKKIFLKNIYEYCCKVNWSQDEISILTKKYEIDVEIIKILISYYINNYMTTEEYQKEEKTIKYLKQKGDLKLQKINTNIYEKLNKISSMLWNDEEEKEILLKYIFEYCEDKEYEISAMKKLALKLGMGQNYRRIQSYAEEYATKKLKITPTEFYERKKIYNEKRQSKISKNRENKTKIIYERLLEATTLEEIIEIIESSETSIERLNSYLVSYIIVHRDGNEIEEKKLKENITVYRNYKNKQKQIERQEQEKNKYKKFLSEAKEVIKLFIEDEESKTLNEFCNNQNIKEEMFNKYTNIIKEQEPDLYNEYKIKVKKNEVNRQENTKENINYIIYLLKNGIEENGIVRNFDLIDYYMNTNINMKEFLKLAKDIVANKDYALLKKFITQNISGMTENTKDIKIIMEEKVEINYEKDKKGMPILGTGEIFTNENKEKIVSFLKDNNIPINRKTYNVAFKRYINGFLDLEIKNEHCKKLTKQH